MKSTLKPKIEERALLLLFYCLCSDICREKTLISVQVACGDHLVLTSQTDDICFSLYGNPIKAGSLNLCIAWRGVPCPPP